LSLVKATSNPIKMSSRSVFIPRVFANISKERIAKVFDSLDLAIVDKIDFVRKQGENGPYNAVYVHLKYWLSTDASREFRDRLFNNADGAKLVYEDPWFWVVLPNTSTNKVSVKNNVRDKHETAAIKALRDAKSPIAPPYLERSAKIYPEKALRIVVPTTPPHSPPHSPSKNSRSSSAPPAIQRANSKLTLENMEANLLAAEDLLAKFAPRPRRDSECSE
jgi:hypothetical protein